MEERSTRPEALPKVVLDTGEPHAIAMSRKGFRGGVGRKKTGSRPAVDVDIPPAAKPFHRPFQREHMGKSALLKPLYQRAKTSLSVLTFPGFTHSYELQKIIGEEAFDTVTDQHWYKIKDPEPIPPLSPLLKRPIQVEEPLFSLKPTTISPLCVKFRHRKRSKHVLSQSFAQKSVSYFHQRGLSNN